MLVGHPSLHRSLKELVIYDATLKDSSHTFSKMLAEVMIKQMDSCLESRAVWIFVAFLEHDCIKNLMIGDLKKHGGKIKALLKEKKGKGIEILAQKIGV